jgi:cation transport ATPase
MDEDRTAGNDARRTEVAMNRSAFTTRLRSLTGALTSPRLEPALLAVTASALTAGGAAWLAGDAGLADLLWGLGTLAAVPPAVGWVVAALRHGRAGVDLIAVLALGGTLAVHEYLAGVLIALMLATGRTLEAAAQRRASKRPACASGARAPLGAPPDSGRSRHGSAGRSRSR